ncbi:hypothetical protein ABID58_004672, partial [Bradyrhizobium sp. S3.2.6]|uniref:hypothetical protein n=1 Tax=Bradyrhizobium sp. S3.2.6 TaxID=3156428 RepID=UPI00339994E9
FADRKRGIRQQPVRSTNSTRSTTQVSWNRSSRFDSSAASSWLRWKSSGGGMMMMMQNSRNGPYFADLKLLFVTCAWDRRESSPLVVWL